MILSNVAQSLMDLYYQQYVKDSDFFKYEDFVDYANIAYSVSLQEDFDRSIVKNMKIGKGNEAELNNDWFTTSEFHVEHKDGKYFAEIGNIFSFKNDGDYLGIKNVYSTNSQSDCQLFVKTSSERLHSLKFLPKSDKSVYYYQVGNTLHFNHVMCGLDSVNVIHIPILQSTEDADKINVPDAIVENVIMRAMNLMKQSKDTPIDKTNDQNPNKVIQTEINS